MTKAELKALIMKDHEKLKRFKGMDKITEERLKALDKLKEGK